MPVKSTKDKTWKDVQLLLDAVRLSIYGKKLYQTPAVKVLEAYYGYLNSPVIDGARILGDPLTAKASLLSAIENAISNTDIEFFVEFTDALKKRNNAHRNRLRVAEYVLHRVFGDLLCNPTTGEKPKKMAAITRKELEKLFEGERGKKNISRIVSELGIKKWIIDERVTGEN